MNIWKIFVKDTNGVFKKGDSWHSDSAHIKYKNWDIIFDNFTLWSGKYSAEMTRVIAPISLSDGFRFEIYREGFIQKIEKLFGIQDIEIGYPDFDKGFIIKSNNGFKIKKILSNKEIRDFLQSLKDVNIKISDQKGIWEQKLPENNFELSYYIDGQIQDLKTLNELLNLFKLLLDGIQETNSIT